MDTLRSVSHLQRELGDELFQAIISSDNTSRVVRFAGTLAGPRFMTIAGHTYEILSFHFPSEDTISHETMVTRAKELGAKLGCLDGHNLMEHKTEIPVEFEDKVIFVFPDWGDGCCYNCSCSAVVFWSACRWVQRWHSPKDTWNTCARFLRRLKPAPPFTMTIAGRVYEALSCLREGEEKAFLKDVAVRAKELDANLGQADGEHVLAHQNEIPAGLRGRVSFNFPAWNDHYDCFFLRWSGGRWVRRIQTGGGPVYADGRLLRRVK